MSAIVEFLPWDTEFFGFRIGRVKTERMLVHDLSDISDFVTFEKIDCVYFLSDMQCTTTPHIAASGEFYVVDVRVEMELDPNRTKRTKTKKVPIRTATTDDTDALAKIARIAHTDSRFFHDRNFPRERCADFYETWLRKSIDGWANATLVADHQGVPSGYITCHLDPSNIGRIGLIGVDENARGQGLGGALVESAIDWLTKNGVQKITVVTQGRNAVAQRLYQKAGFLTANTKVWHHQWNRNAQMR
jgi:dTDP-4-amino-4,6-dideoxy-D-galactose acyltransferase